MIWDNHYLVEIYLLKHATLIYEYLLRTSFMLSVLMLDGGDLQKGDGGEGHPNDQEIDHHGIIDTKTYKFP